MYILQVYIEGQRVDLFQDETVSLNSSVQNIKDISKVFTDFTQSFTIPASNVNNKIFKHWGNADIISGFDAKVRKSATLELSNMPFKEGKIQLDGTNLKDGKPTSYKITFFGNLVNLSDLFGEDLLSDLDLTAYDHDYTSANVKEGMTNGLLSGNIIYPLISSVRNWNWNSGGTSLEDDDIKYASGDTNGIVFNELKPAIKINRIIEAIENKYSVTFSDDFLKIDNHINDLFLWLNYSKGNIQSYSDEELMFSGINFTAGVGFFTVAVAPESGYDTVDYKLRIVNTTTGEEVTHQNSGGSFYYVLLGTGIYAIYVSATVKFVFTVTYAKYPSSAVTSPVTTITNGNTTISANLPEMKVVDFFGGLIKMFNLVIDPTSATTFDIKPLDQWYLNGSERDLSKYINLNDITIDRPVLYKKINFKYKEAKNILSAAFEDANQIGYGDLEAEFDYDGGELKIEVPFENMLMEKLPSVLSDFNSEVHVGFALNKELSEVDLAPVLFYNRGAVTIASGFGFVDEDGNVEEVKTYLNTGQENVITGITNSINFGSEINSWTLLPETESLYSNFWQDYITDLYDEKRREYKYTAILPLAIITELKLNDKITIRDRVYIINSMKSNLTTGVVKFGLLNYIGTVTTSSAESLQANLSGTSSLYAKALQFDPVYLDAHLIGTSEVYAALSQFDTVLLSADLVGTSEFYGVLNIGPGGCCGLQDVTDVENVTDNSVESKQDANNYAILYPTGTVSVKSDVSGGLMFMDAASSAVGNYNDSIYKSTLLFPTVATANKTITLQDKTGTVALLSDITGGGYTLWKLYVDGVHKGDILDSEKVNLVGGDGITLTYSTTLDNTITIKEEYTTYVAIVNQLGTSAPTVTVIKNTLGGTVVWAYSAIGSYTATLSGAFITNKTSIIYSSGREDGVYGTYPVSANVVVLNSSNLSGLPANNLVWNGTIEIKVYP